MANLGPTPRSYVIHLSEGLLSVSCGAHAGWASRGYTNLDLPRTTVLSQVTCGRCKLNWRFK